MMYDIIIVGCGPAGMTAAIYALRSNKKVLILEGESIGGQISSSPLIENYPGFIKISGSEFVNNLYEQVINLGGIVEFEKVVKIEEGNPKKVITEQNIYKASAIILATGSKHRLLALPNEDKFIGNGISFCVTCDAPFYKGEVVAVAGGGSSAVSNALYLSKLCKKVYLIHRNENFKCEETLKQELKNTDNIEVITNAVIKEYIGKNTLEKIKIIVNQEEKIIDLDGLFLSIGTVPLSELAGSIINLSESNYIVSDENCETNIKGIFIAGDAREKKIRQLTTATSDGTIAAINAVKYIDKK